MLQDYHGKVDDFKPTLVDYLIFLYRITRFFIQSSCIWMLILPQIVWAVFTLLAEIVIEKLGKLIYPSRK
jgi:hypothetical protein